MPAGASKQQLLGAVANRMADDLASAVGKGDAGERARKLSKAMNEQGILMELEQTTTGKTLCIYSCPYEGVASAHREILQDGRIDVESIDWQPTHTCAVHA